MQGQNSLFRGSVLVVTGAVTTVALGLLVYRHLKFNDTQNQAEIKLHRRNAVRRRRRRWRRGFQPIDLDYDPLAKALNHLKEREEAGIGYGLYTNQFYVTPDISNSNRDDLHLLPSRLEHIHTFLVQRAGLSPTAENQLKLHIHSVFMGNFLTEEYPAGYLVDGDVDELSRILREYIAPYTVQKCVEAFDQAGYAIEMDYQCPGSQTTAQHSYVAGGSVLHNDTTQPLSPTELRGRLAEAGGWTDQDGEQQHGQNVLDLLYRIGEEQAKRSGYQHRGVECNGCGMQPVRGIRYHCANCWDYDLCEACESQQMHHKTHVFYKIRIPAPTRGQIKLIQPVWYPGNPNACLESIPAELKAQLLKDTELDRQDLDALYDQFKCIAGHNLGKDPHGIGMAIDKPDFHRYFSTTTADRPSKPNLIHDRIFVFYDRDADGLISFYEFARGMAELMHNTSRHARIERAFRAFDLDSDGYVQRKDFIRMLRAHYALNKELSEEIIFAREDTILADEEVREIIRGSNPISAAFGGSSFAGHRSRHGDGKSLDEIGDMVMKDVYESILRDDSALLGNRMEAIARHASGGRALLHKIDPEYIRTEFDEPIISTSQNYAMSDDYSEPDVSENLEVLTQDIDFLGQPHQWPRNDIDISDVRDALGSDVPLDDVLDPLDRQRVLFAQSQRQFREKEEELNQKEDDAIRNRWQKREFYMDEDEGFGNPDTTLVEAYKQSKAENTVALLSAADSSIARPPRSSSKVRFEEGSSDADYDGQGTTPANEQWPRLDFATADRDIGRELIYEAVQEAFIEMLDHFFDGVEEEATLCASSRQDRWEYADELKRYEDSLQLKGATPAELVAHQDKIRAEALRAGEATYTTNVANKKDQEMHKTIGMNGSAIKSSVIVSGAESPNPDPTLPQNRPNESSDFDKAEVEAQVLFHVFDQSYSVNPMDLIQWHEHNLMEQEARKRQGFGKLNLREFRKKLKAGTDGESVNDDEFWEARADLGRFSFLSTWLEMASF